MLAFLPCRNWSADSKMVKWFGGVGIRSTLFIHISMEANYHNLALLTNRINDQLKRGYLNMNENHGI